MAHASIERATRTAEAFSRALAAGDATALAHGLDAACEADFAGRVVAGREAIVARLVEEAARLRRSFEEARRECVVESVEPEAASLLVTDYLLEVPLGWRRRPWRIDVRLNAGGLIDRLEADAPGPTPPAR